MKQSCALLKVTLFLCIVRSIIDMQRVDVTEEDIIERVRWKQTILCGELKRQKNKKEEQEG